MIGRGFALFSLLFGAALALPAAAQTPAEFYRGKMVNLIIGEAAGGDYDAWGRIVAHHIAVHIPGNPTVVPQNVPGAGGLLALNQIGNTAPKDGTTFGIVNRGMPLDPLLGDAAARFDPRKLAWIGSPERDVIVCSVQKDAPVQSLQDLFSKELIVGATGAGADTLTYPQFLSGLLGLKMKIVRGFPGSTPIVLAIERGEVQGICNSYSSISRQAYFRNGNLKVILQAGQQPDARLPDVPLLGDLAKTEADVRALDLFLASGELGRPFVAPEAVPAERLAALRQAFADTMQDPAFIEDTKKQRLNLSPIKPERILEVIEQAYRTPKPVIARVAELLGRDGAASGH